MGAADQAGSQGHPRKTLCAGEIQPGSESRSLSGKGYEFGRGRPPKATQWKKGKSANPGGQSSPQPTGLLEMIDKLLLASVKITRDGVPKRVTTLEAILEQLWSKGIAGDRRARAVYFRCLE